MKNEILPLLQTTPKKESQCFLCEAFSVSFITDTNRNVYHKSSVVLFHIFSFSVGEGKIGCRLCLID